MLDFAQLEEGKKTFSFTPVNLLLAADEAVQAFRQSGPEQHVQLSRAANVDGLDVLGDRTAIVQCLSNLIDNAIKYSPSAVTVIVTCGRDHRGPFVEVRDHGIGISSSDRQKIFEKFYRASNARELGVQGTGIGLAFVQRVMDAHRGSVTVESQPGQGSVFRLVFPHEG